MSVYDVVASKGWSDAPARQDSQCTFRQTPASLIFTTVRDFNKIGNGIFINTSSEIGLLPSFLVTPGSLFGTAMCVCVCAGV